MFDIGFTEIILISVVALVVLGPERLPGAIRTAGLWIGRLRRSFNTIKRDIEKEIGADEIRRQLRNEEIMAKFGNTRTQFTKTIDSVKQEAESIKKDITMEEELAAFKGGKTAKPTETDAVAGLTEQTAPGTPTDSSKQPETSVPASPDANQTAKQAPEGSSTTTAAPAPQTATEQPSEPAPQTQDSKGS